MKGFAFRESRHIEVAGSNASTVEHPRYHAMGLEIETAVHAWVHWRSLYVTDPEGNQVELVCYDSGV